MGYRDDQFRIRIAGTTIRVQTNVVAISGLTFVILSVYCYVFLHFMEQHPGVPLSSSHDKSAENYSPQLTLILSQQRSGSSWLGAIFDADPEIFYLFEPLHAKIYQSAALQLSTVDAQVEILHNICTCNFEKTDIPSYGLLERSSVGNRALTMLYAVDTAYLQSECLRAKRRVAKVVKITDVAVLERLQRLYPGCSLDVVHLVRDPRGSINSRMRTFQRFFPGEVTRTEFSAAEVSEASRTICAQRERIVDGLSRFDLADRVITFKYENLAEEPLTSAGELFAKLQLPLSKPVYNFIIESSRASSTEQGGYETKKQSRVVYKQWKETMSNEHLTAATQSCSRLLSLLGYPLQISDHEPIT